MARPAGQLRSVYDLLQSVRSLATSGRVGQIMNALAGAHDAALQMIDTSIVRVHQHGACISRNRRQSMGWSRGGLTSKIHALVDKNGLPLRLALTPGEAHDNRLARKFLSRLKPGSMLLADRGYDADWIRELVTKNGAWALRALGSRSAMRPERASLNARHHKARRDGRWRRQCAWWLEIHPTPQRAR
jgi:transposase